LRGMSKTSLTLLLMLISLVISSSMLIHAQAQELVFLAPNAENGLSVWVSNLDGSGAHQVPVPLLNVDYMTVSLQGNLIAVVGQTLNDLSNGVHNLYVFDPAGGGFEAETQITGQEVEQQHMLVIPYYPTLSADGREIAYTLTGVDLQESPPTSVTTVWLANTGEPGSAVLVGTVPLGSGGVLGLSLSPDGSYLAASAPCSSGCPQVDGVPVPTNAIYIAPAVQNGEQQAQQVTSPTLEGDYVFTDVLPAFSPDGGKVAFVRALVNPLQPDANPLGVQVLSSGILVLDLNSGQLKEVLPQGNQVIYDVAWTPDGNSLLFSVMGGGTWEVNLDGSGLRQISQGDFAYFVPEVAQNGGGNQGGGQGNNVTFQPYVHSSPGWSIMYPEGWRSVENSSPTAPIRYVLFFPSNGSVNEEFAVSWSSAYNVSQLEAALESNLGHPSVIATNFTEVAGIEAKAVVYELNYSGTNYFLASFYFTEGGYSFAVFYLLPLVSWQFLEGELWIPNHMVKSLSFPPAASTTSQATVSTSGNGSSASSSGLLNFTSELPPVSFSYPQGWKVESGVNGSIWVFSPGNSSFLAIFYFEKVGSVSEVRSDYESGLSSQGRLEVVSENSSADVGGLRALEVTYQYTFSSSGRTVEMVTYYLVQDHHGLIVTYSYSDPSSASKLAQVVDSIRLNPNWIVASPPNSSNDEVFVAGKIVGALLVILAIASVVFLLLRRSRRRLPPPPPPPPPP
jgi:Tol biopolymer transport system component